MEYCIYNVEDPIDLLRNIHSCISLVRTRITTITVSSATRLVLLFKLYARRKTSFTSKNLWMRNVTRAENTVGGINYS